MWMVYLWLTGKTSFYHHKINSKNILQEDSLSVSCFCLFFQNTHHQSPNLSRLLWNTQATHHLSHSQPTLRLITVYTHHPQTKNTNRAPLCLKIDLKPTVQISPKLIYDSATFKPNMSPTCQPRRLGLKRRCLKITLSNLHKKPMTGLPVHDTSG